MNGPTFYTDVEFPNQHYGMLIRSPIERGHLVDIQPPKLPDGFFMYTATDVPGENKVSAMGTTIPVFAAYDIMYLGEPLGIIVGPDLDTVQELVSEVLIETEVLESYAFDEKFSAAQVVGKRVILEGDPDEILAAAGRVFETSSSVGPQDHFYAEPLGTNVHVADGKLEILTATQWPFHVRSSVSAVLDLDLGDIVVRPTAIGEALDGKLWFPSLLSAQAALATVLCKKPVKIAFSRQEDFLFSVKSAPMRIRFRTALNDDGNIAAMVVRVLINAGAYSPLIDEIIDRVTVACAGLYSVSAFRIETYALRTNLPPMGALSGLGEAPALFALETHVASIIQTLGVSPVEWKLMNTIAAGRRTVTGESSSGEARLTELFNAVCLASDFTRKYSAYAYLNARRAGYRDGPLRGMGIVCGYQGNGFIGKTLASTSYAVEVSMETDGQVHIKCGFFSQSMRKIFSQIATETLGIEERSISFTGVDTSTMPPTGPDTLSSKIAILAPLMEKCCQTIQRQRFRSPLPISVKKVYKPSRKDAWDEATLKGKPFVSVTPAVCAVELELDPLTYEVIVRGIWIACDAGKIYNRAAALTTIRKTIPIALSRILTEHILTKDGKYAPKDSTQYDLLQPSLLPDLSITLLDSGELPRGIGSIANNLLPAAYATALSQITGKHVPTIPVGVEAVYEALEGEHDEEAKK